jgi:broad specificity phosphatase PhoE
MSMTEIMIVRHAEKPDTDRGVAPDGSQNVEELTVRGWQRAGALVGLFAPIGGHFIDSRLATPNAIFASGIGHHSSSMRPQHTVLPLAEKLGLTIDASHLKGEEEALAQAAAEVGGVVLIAWEHERIPEIVRAIPGNDTRSPQAWPGDRFDVVWIFDRSVAAEPWSFGQVPQLLLAGDRADPIAMT